MRSSQIHHPGDGLSTAELSALRLDGTVHDVGEAFMPADLPESPDARALSVVRLLPAGFAASGPSAAWVHGAGDRAPNRHHARPIGTRRSRAASSLRLIVHEARVPPEDLLRFSGVGVVGIAETVVDLARTADAAENAAWLTALVRLHPEHAEQAVDRLRARTRLPGKHRAIQALERAMTR